MVGLFVELKARFATFDKEGNGMICSDDLVALLRSIGLNPTKSECENFKKNCASGKSYYMFDVYVTYKNFYVYGAI